MSENKLKDSLNELYSSFVTTAELLGRRVNFLISNGSNIYEYFIETRNELKDGVSVFTAILKHGDTILNIVTDTVLTNAITKAVVIGASGVAVIEGAPIAATFLVGAGITMTVETINKTFNVEGMNQTVWDTTLNEVDYKEVIKATKMLANISNVDEYTVDQLKMIGSIADTYHDVSLSNIATEVNKYQTVTTSPLKFTTGLIDDSKPYILVGNQMMIRNTAGDLVFLFNVPDPGTYTHIILDNTTNELVVTYPDGYVGYIQPGNYENDETIIYGDEGNLKIG